MAKKNKEIDRRVFKKTGEELQQWLIFTRRGSKVESGKKYRFYMFAKCEKDISVSVMLTSENGKVYAKHRFEINEEYNKYECEFESNANDHNARFALFSDSNETVTLGFVSLFPRDTFLGRENGLRKSLAERLLKLKPAFLRFPGGCIVEGFTKETAFRFKDTIGPVWERKPHWLLWSYMTTNGLGFHEHLQFCEDANIDAMYVFNCGMTCQGRCPDYFDEKHILHFRRISTVCLSFRFLRSAKAQRRQNRYKLVRGD